MAPPNTTVRMSSAEELKKLMTGPQISVGFLSSPTAKPQQIAVPVPKKVLVHFSKVLKDALTTGTQLPNTIQTDRSTWVAVGPCAEAGYIAVFKWMLKSCAGNGIVKFDRMPIIQYVKVVDVCKQLGIQILLDHLMNRLEFLIRWQYPFSDLRAIYATVHPDSPIRTLAIKSIVDAVLEKRLFNRTDYNNFKNENLTYEADVYAYLDDKDPEAAADRRTRTAERAEREERRAEREAGKQRRHQEYLERKARREANAKGPQNTDSSGTVGRSYC